MFTTLNARVPARTTIRLALATALVVAVAAAPATTAGAAPPDNDAFADAIALQLDVPVTVDTSEATNTDPEDLIAKNECGSPPFFTDDPPDNTVWFTYTNDGADPLRILLSAAPPMFVTPGFNVLVDHGGGLHCAAGGPVEVVWVAEPGETYYIQSIDDQIPPDWDGDPANLDTVGGGDLTVTATSLGVPLPEICPGFALDSPELPPGLNLILGTDGDDELVGTNGNDLIVGLEGDDEIDGRGGDDVIIGCNGEDDIDGGSGDDFIFGDNPIFGDLEAPGGDDEIHAGSGNDTVFGGPGDDDIEGGNGDDELFGQPGNDDIEAGRGNDFVVGGFGDDDIDGGNGNDELFGGFDSDEIDGGNGDDYVNGDVPAPFPDESPHSDECDGGRGNDVVENCEEGDD
ncbi:MAG: hypothetical protein HKN41_04260 [Ilumatobacter sp.]|nr:hypothetical protein [Ilumatobacter sp.]